jgi:polysaccharide pyruvyl transferase WcaK-like protein
VAYEIRAAVFAQRPMLRARAIVVREFTTFTELTEEMMRAEVVVASRFHNLICALRLARPTVSVGYARKNRHVMQALSLDEYCQDIDQLDGDRLVAQIQAARENAQKLTSRIRRGTSEYAGKVESLLELVFEETLGLPVPFGRTVDLPDELNLPGEVDAWHGS